jgi:nucleotide-binding universal stress UspA family protein
MFKRLLAALDGSACSEDALEVALDLAAARSAGLYVCSVADRSFEAATDVVERAKRLAGARGIACTADVLEGKTPAAAVIAHARAVDADCIVAGTHGRSGFAKTIYGSTAQEILETAPCAVITVRRPRIESSKETG